MGRHSQAYTNAGSYNSPLPDAEWHHIAFTFDGNNTIQFYRDGILIATKTLSNGGIRSGALPLHIGENFSASERFCGLLDGVRLSSGVRTAFPHAAFAAVRPEPATSAGNQLNVPPAPTATPTPTSTSTATATPTPLPTATSTATGTATNTPTSTPTPLPIAAFGTGADSDLIVAAGETAYTDNVRAELVASAASGQPSLNLNSVAGLAAGHELLLIQVHGTGAGRYEFGRIAAINGNTVTLQQNLVNAYTRDDSSRAQVVRVPNYRNVSVLGGGVLTAHSWNGATGGVIAFRSSGTTTIAGMITIHGGNGFSSNGDQQGRGDGGGFRGGNNSTDDSGAWAGEGYVGGFGIETTNRRGNGGGGAGGRNPDYGNNSGAGGGYGSNGGNGSTCSPSCVQGGDVAGDAVMSTIFFGGGGGGARNPTGSGAGGGARVAVSLRSMHEH